MYGRGALVIAVLAFAPEVAHADAAEGKRLGEVADKQARAKRYDDAARSYRAAFRAQPLPEYLCNVGVAYFKGNDLPRARRYLGECLVIGAALDATFLARVRKVVDEVEAKLEAGPYAAIDVAVEPPSTTITVTGDIYDEPFVGSGRIWVPRGKHQLGLHAEGHRDEVVEVDASTAVVRIREVLAVMAHPTPSPPVSDPPAPRARASRVAPITVTVITGVAALGALGLYAYARRVADDAEHATDQETYDDRVDTARAFQRASWITGGVAGLGAVAAVYLWVRSSRTDRSVAIQPARDGAMVTMRVGF